jgi:C-terminal processing protease CtpA/Prc
VIARVMHGGAADRSGLIHAGDEVIEVNGINVELKTPADVLAILVSQFASIDRRNKMNTFYSKTPKGR